LFAALPSKKNMSRKIRAPRSRMDDNDDEHFGVKKDSTELQVDTNARGVRTDDTLQTEPTATPAVVSHLSVLGNASRVAELLAKEEGNIRSEICADYRKTGRCRRGASCKFAHTFASGDNDGSFCILRDKRDREAQEEECERAKRRIAAQQKEGPPRCVVCQQCPADNPMVALSGRCPSRHVVCAMCVRGFDDTQTLCPAQDCGVVVGGDYVAL